MTDGPQVIPARTAGEGRAYEQGYADAILDMQRDGLGYAQNVVREAMINVFAAIRRTIHDRREDRRNGLAYAQWCTITEAVDGGPWSTMPFAEIAARYERLTGKHITADEVRGLCGGEHPLPRRRL